jgi:hypothetical protein
MKVIYNIKTPVKLLEGCFFPPCDIITKRRVREVYEVPGALWHIFDAIDADKIRDFLNMVCSSHLSQFMLKISIFLCYV